MPMPWPKLWGALTSRLMPGQLQLRSSSPFSFLLFFLPSPFLLLLSPHQVKYWHCLPYIKSNSLNCELWTWTLSAADQEAHSNHSYDPSSKYLEIIITALNPLLLYYSHRRPRQNPIWFSGTPYILDRKVSEGVGKWGAWCDSHYVWFVCCKIL